MQMTAVVAPVPHGSATAPPRRPHDLHTRVSRLSKPERTPDDGTADRVVVGTEKPPVESCLLERCWMFQPLHHPTQDLRTVARFGPAADPAGPAPEARSTSRTD